MVMVIMEEIFKCEHFSHVRFFLFELFLKFAYYAGTHEQNCNGTLWSNMQVIYERETGFGQEKEK